MAKSSRAERRVESAHLVDLQIERRRLNGQVRHRLAQIVESVAIGAGDVIKVELGDRQDQNRRLLLPTGD